MLQCLTILFFISSFPFIILEEIPDNLELIFVYEHIRHGARGPSTSYNSLFKDGVDEFGVSWEGEGDGELTTLGKRQHYTIGVRNRIKYGKGKNGLGLIDFSQYNPEEVLFHSTDYNRTHQSLNSELLGMYQPGILKTLNQQQLDKSYPQNKEEWMKKKDKEPIYTEIFEEIQKLENRAIIDNIPVFNIHPFPENRTFNFETNCKNLDNIREKSLEGKDELLYGYFLQKKEKLKEFFKFENYSYFSNIRMMNSITDHYISDYINCKDLSQFQTITGIELDEFYQKCTKFYHDWMYNFYCSNETCSMDSSRLMEDVLGYMERRINKYPNTTYHAPKLVIDNGHDTTVAPMQMFMYEAFEHKPEYGINTKYCGFACNIFFELYKDKNEYNKYYVYYYINDELIHIFDYNEFNTTIREHLYTQKDIEEYCLTDEEKEQKRKEGESNKNTEEENLSFFEKNKSLWIALFIFIFTTILGIIGIIILLLKIKHQNKSSDNINTNKKDATMNLMESMD